MEQWILTFQASCSDETFKPADAVGRQLLDFFCNPANGDSREGYLHIPHCTGFHLSGLMVQCR